jgi:hypothetical protein
MSSRGEPLGSAKDLAPIWIIVMVNLKLVLSLSKETTTTIFFLGFRQLRVKQKMIQSKLAPAACHPDEPLRGEEGSRLDLKKITTSLISV